MAAKVKVPLPALVKPPLKLNDAAQLMFWPLLSRVKLLDELLKRLE